MPINKIVPSKRAAAAIAAIVGATVSSFVAIFPGQAPVHDDVAVKTLVQPWEGRSLARPSHTSRPDFDNSSAGSNWDRQPTSLGYLR